MAKSSAEKRENEVLLRMLNTPPKPQADMKVNRKAIPPAGKNQP